MDNGLEKIQNALVEFDRVEAGLAIMERNYGGVIYDVETPEGMAFAKQARKNVRDPRIATEKVRKGAKEYYLSGGRDLDSRAQRITLALLALEEPIDEQIKNEENKEKRRLERNAERLEAIRRLPASAAGLSHAAALAAMTAAQATDLTDMGEAGSEALAVSVAALKGIVAERQAFEADQARIAVERLELDKLRAEQAQRDAAVQAERAAEQAKAEQTLQAERQALADEARRQAVERAVLAAEQVRIAMHEQARQAETARLQAAEQARIAAADKAKADAAIKVPSLADMAKVIAAHYQVPQQTAYGWLREAFNKLSEQWVA